MTNMAEQIYAVFPMSKEVTLKGKPFIIKPFGFGQYPTVLKVLKDFKGADKLPEDLKEKQELTYAQMAGLVADNAEAVMTLCQLATKEKEEFFADLPGDEGIALCLAIVKVNADFFVQRLTPRLLEMLSELPALAGALSSQDSSAPVTGSAT